MKLDPALQLPPAPRRKAAIAARLPAREGSAAAKSAKQDAQYKCKMHQPEILDGTARGVV